MRIRAVRSERRAVRLKRPYAIASRRIESADLVYVEIVADDGRVGLGCAAPNTEVTGETGDTCAGALDAGNVAWLTGRDAGDDAVLREELPRRLGATPAARAALDMAIHDLRAVAAGRPLVEMLGRRHLGMPTSITVGIQSVTDAIDEAREYVGRGFRHLKVKLGRDLEQDLERIRRLREAVGNDVHIRVDANQGYRPAEARRLLEQAEPLHLELVEQPVAVADTDALRDLPAALRARVALDESLVDAADARRLAADPAACGIFNIKLNKCGGVTPAGDIAAVARTHGLELMWGCGDESVISIAAALHAACAAPATCYLDLDGSFDLAEDRATGGFHLQDGVLTPLERPGLGVRLAG